VEFLAKKGDVGEASCDVFDSGSEINDTVRCTVLAPDDIGWRTVLSTLPHDFYHLPSYVDLCAQLENGKAIAFHVVGAGNHFLLPVILRAVPDFGIPTLRGWTDARSPYGYAGPLLSVTAADSKARAAFARRATRAVVNAMRQLRIVTGFIRCHPLLTVPAEVFNSAGQIVTHGRTVSIDLTLSAEDIWKQFRRNHRSDIKRLCATTGAVVEHDYEWRHLEDYLQAYRETLHRVRASDSYAFNAKYYQGLRDALGEKVHLFVVKIGHEVAAAGVFTEFCGIVQYHLGATLDKHLKHHPNKLLCHEVSLWAKARGNRWLHIGGGVGGREDSLYQFKAGFSQLRHPYQTWRICSDDDVYAQLIAASQPDLRRDPDDDYFPPYRNVDHR